jgi:ribonuclease HII
VPFAERPVPLGAFGAHGADARPVVNSTEGMRGFAANESWPRPASALTPSGAAVLSRAPDIRRDVLEAKRNPTPGAGGPAHRDGPWAYAGAAMAYEAPTHSVERSLRATVGARIVAGIDEVGRGAWAGPVTVCAAVTGLRRPPDGLTDSKLITPKRRAAMADLLADWVTDHALGHASPEEIDELGMTAALRLAALRALKGLAAQPDAVILDGKHDYLGGPWRVRTVIKGDQSCVAVAAASVIAKVHRDAMMAELGVEYSAFGFADNAGYPSPVHRAALAEWGPTPHHRMSWAYLDTLPRWRHLKKVRGPADEAEQLGLDF